VRRDFLKALVATAGLPAVAAAEVLKPQPGDTIVLKFKERLSAAEYARLRASWDEATKGTAAAEQRIIILDGGADIALLRKA
jgi:hypothetical protein